MKTKERDSTPGFLHNRILPPVEDEVLSLAKYSDTVMRDFKEKTLKKERMDENTYC
jgi:hypothetical protein